MIIVERPTDMYYFPIANNFVIRLTENNIRYCEVLINDVNRLVFYPFGNSIYMNLKESLKGLFLDSSNLVQGYRVKITINTYTAAVLPVATQTFFYTLLPFGVNYSESIIRMQQPISSDFLATPIRVVRWVSYPFSAIKYNANGAAIVTTADGLIIETRAETCGTYLRFVNDYGGWSYWLFNKANIVKQTQDLGQIYNDYNSFGNTVTPEIQRGKDSNDVYSCTSGVLRDWEQLIVKPIFSSPLVQYWNGDKWLSVRLTSSSYQTKTTKHKNIDYSITFALPDDNNVNI